MNERMNEKKRPFSTLEEEETQGKKKPIYARLSLDGFPGDTVVKNLPANAGDTGSILGSGRSPGEGHVNPLQYSCLENPMDRGA